MKLANKPGEQVSKLSPTGLLWVLHSNSFPRGCMPSKNLDAPPRQGGTLDMGAIEANASSAKESIGQDCPESLNEL